MRSLVLKEARSLAFGTCLLLIWLGLDWGITLLAGFPDQRSLASWMDRTRSITELFVLFVVAVALAQGLLVRDQDEGTLSFQDALPVSRDRVFMVKFLLATGVVWLLPLNELIQRVWLHWLSRDSLNMGFHWDVLLTETALTCAMGFVFLAMGLAVSFLRRFAFVALGLWFVGLFALRLFRAAFAAELNPFTMTRPVFDGQRWLVPWEQLAVQLLVGSLCLWTALRSYRELGDRTSRLETVWARHRRGGLIAGIGLGLVALLAGTSAYLNRQQTAKSDGQHGTAQEVRAASARHEFVYRASDAERAKVVIDNSEVTRDQVEQFLGVTLPGRVVVDMTGGLERHAGRAYWKKIRMSLSDGPRDRAVFAHELTHVLLTQAARGRLEDSFNSTRFFHEGLATFVERRWYPLPEGGDLSGAYRIAAVALAWHAVRFEELVDDVRLSRRLDRDLVYPFGAVFVDGLVQRYGTNAPGRVAAAFGRADAPKGLEGLRLWRDTLQSCGYNLADVVADFYAGIEQAVVREREFISSIPRLQGAVEVSANQIVIRAVRQGGTNREPLRCRVRQQADTDPRLDLVFDSSGDDQFRVPRGNVPNRSFWYQLGVRPARVGQVIYEAWVEARLP